MRLDLAKLTAADTVEGGNFGSFLYSSLEGQVFRVSINNGTKNVRKKCAMNDPT